MKEVVRLSRELVNQLLHQAQISPAAEICGLIGTADNDHMYCYPVRNTATDRGHRFWMDPEEQILAMRTMRDNRQRLFAIYHSHPDAPAVPSSVDLEYASYPEALQIIISLNTKGVLEMRAFRLTDHDRIEEAILLLKDN